MTYYTPVTKAIKDGKVAKDMVTVMPFIPPLFEIISFILEPSGWNDKVNSSIKREIGTAVGEIIVEVARDLQSKHDSLVSSKINDVAADIRARVYKATGWKFPCKEWNRCSEFMALYCEAIGSKSDPIKAEEPIELIDLKGKIDILQGHSMHEIKTGHPAIEDLLQVMAYHDGLKESGYIIDKIHLVYVQCQTEVKIDIAKLKGLDSYKKSNIMSCLTFDSL